MTEESVRKSAELAMRKINHAWLHGQIEDIAPFLHDEIIMVLPGWTSRIQGKDSFLSGFRDFSHNAKVHEFHEHEFQVDVAGSAAVVSFRYEMVYERSGMRYRSTGRDLWVFQMQDGKWVAFWRTMLDMEEIPA